MPQTDIYIYGMIGKPWWADDDYNGVNEVDVLNALNKLDKADAHNVHFNTAGGVVKVGIGIMNCMRAHSQKQKMMNANFKLNTINDGICYSAGSYGFLVGDNRTMNLGSNILVHRASTYAEGNADDLMNVVNELKGVDSTLANLYADILGKTAEHWQNLMALDQVVNADQAVELGLATAADHASNATNFFPDFTPENVMKEGYRKLQMRASHANLPKVDLLSKPTKEVVAATINAATKAINTRLLEAELSRRLARLDI